MEDTRQLDDFLSRYNELNTKIKNKTAKQLLQDVVFSVIKQSERTLDKESINKVLARYKISTKEPQGIVKKFKPRYWPDQFLENVDLVQERNGVFKFKVKKGKSVTIGKKKYGEGAVIPLPSPEDRVSWEDLFEQFHSTVRTKR